MSFIAIILITLSASIHTGWNLLSKHQNPSTAFFLLASAVGTIALAPSLILGYRMLHAITPQIWPLLVCAGFFMALYYTALAQAYRAGDMSVAYPLARSTPIITVSIITFTLGYTFHISIPYMIGACAIIAGGFLIPLERFDTLRIQNYRNPTCGFALLAAIGITGYSILDDIALRQLRSHAESTIDAVHITLLYACLEAFMTTLWLALFITCSKNRRNQLQHAYTRKQQIVVVGIAIQAAYVLVLISLAFVDNVSYVVGFRQLSIPLGALCGMLLFKEIAHRPKLVGIAIMSIGLVSIAVG